MKPSTQLPPLVLVFLSILAAAAPAGVKPEGVKAEGAKAEGEKPESPKPRKLIHAYDLRPMVYWGIGGGMNVIRFGNEDELCEQRPDGTFENCLGVPVGGGVILFGGIRPHPLFALDLSWDFFLHTRSEVYSHATIQSFRLDLKLYVYPGLNLEPYVQLGGGLYWFGDEYSWTRGGGGFQAGGGFDVVWLPGFSTGLLVLYRGVYFWERGGPTTVFPGTYTGNLEATVNLTFRYDIR
jgi:hypothetical protein